MAWSPGAPPLIPHASSDDNNIRRPLELRMVHTIAGDERAAEAGGQPWAVFDDDKTTKYLDFEEVRGAIATRTDQVATLSLSLWWGPGVEYRSKRRYFSELR